MEGDAADTSLGRKLKQTCREQRHAQHPSGFWGRMMRLQRDSQRIRASPGSHSHVLGTEDAGVGTFLCRETRTHLTCLPGSGACSPGGSHPRQAAPGYCSESRRSDQVSPCCGLLPWPCWPQLRWTWEGLGGWGICRQDVCWTGCRVQHMTVMSCQS